MQMRGPAEVLRGVKCRVTYREKLERLAKKAGGTITDSAETLAPFVNEGRWVATCPSCNAGISLHRDWPEAYCLSCFRVFVRFDWPADAGAIERALLGRPLRNRNWSRRELLEHLLEENVLHGIASQDGAVQP